MYNWSINLKKLAKNPKQAVIWKLQQAINFGLNGKKLNRRLVKRHWKGLYLDPPRRKFLKFLLWPKKP
jgi:hypothetical protein